MYNQISIITSSDDNPIHIRRVASTINHKAPTEWQYVTINIKDYKGKSAPPLFIEGTKVYVLYGTEVINAVLGSVRGRNAAIKKDGVWYVTLPNPSQLHIEQYKIAAAKQLIKAITIIDNFDTYDYPVIEKYVVQSADEIKTFVSEALKGYMFAFDFETNNELLVHSPTFRATCLAISYNPTFSWIIPEELLYDEASIKELSVLFDSDLIKIAHNIQFDLKILWKLNIKTRGRYSCTKLISFILDENSSNGLKECIDRDLPDFSGYDYGVSFVGDKEKLYTYAATDTCCTLILHCMYYKELIEDEYFYPMYRSIYIPAMEVLAEMEYNGALVDDTYLDEMIRKISVDIEDREQSLQELPDVKKYIVLHNEELTNKEIDALKDKIKVKSELKPDDHWIVKWQSKIDNIRKGGVVFYSFFDMGSPKDLGDFLYTSKGLSLPQPMRPEKQPNGRTKLVPSMSTDAGALNDIDHPITHSVQILRSLKQLLSTFYKSIRDKSINGKIYPTFNHIGAVTGRLSSSAPNLQNLPSRGKFPEILDIAKGVKKAFVAPDGYNVIAADLSQAELRTIAHFSGDETMINAYLNNIDIHAVTGQRIYKFATLEEFMASDVYKEGRQKAKSANFGIVYGISEDGYIIYVKDATGQDISLTTAKEHRESVFGAYPKLLTWHSRMEKEVREKGYVRTLQGLKRRLPDIYSSNRSEVSAAIRLAINNPIQGTIGLYALWVMVWLRHRYPDFQFFTTVHDSMVGYAPIGTENEIKGIIKETPYNLPTTLYFNFPEFIVPLTMDTEIGPTYGDLKEY